MDDEQQRQLALELRGTLESVVTDEQARRALEEELDAALALPPAESGQRLEEVLRAREETRAWMREHDPEPPDVERLTELGGRPIGQLGTYYVCPEGDYDWVRENVGAEVPLCPIHHVPLAPEV